MFRPLMCVAIRPASGILFFLAASGATASAEGGGRTLGEVFHSGGSVMWVLLLQSILLVTLVAEGWRRFRLAQLRPAETQELVNRLVAEGDLARAQAECRTRPDLYSAAVGGALGRFSRGPDAVRDAASDVLHVRATSMRGWLNYLSAIGVTAPMLGLLGTVTGMIKAFENLGHSGVADMTGLSGAISEVLVATAGGLIVGIPAFVAYYLMKNHLAGSLAEVEKDVFDLVDSLPYGATPVESHEEEPGAQVDRL